MNKNLLSKISLMGLFAALTACGPGGDKRAAVPKPAVKSPLVIPVPAEFSAGTGAFRVDAATVLVYSGGAGAAEAAKYFDELAQQDPQLTVRRPREDDSESNAISFVRVENDASFGPEAYAIVAKPDGVTVKARTPAGLLYGAVTLWQLLTLATPQNGIGQIPALEIRDAPRFAWRGLMLDSARHYQSPEYIKKFIDNMAQHKLNVLHWHLTDDQAWRLEIKKYPKLTSVGAWRVPEGQAPRADIDPKTGKPRLHGGFYTQEQARDIVAYAAARNIKVIPEIEMPGHASAAIVAYPELGVARGSSTQGSALRLGRVRESLQRRGVHVQVPGERADRSHRSLPERIHPRGRRRGRQAAMGEVAAHPGAHEGVRRRRCAPSAGLLHPAHGQVHRVEGPSSDWLG